MKNFTVGIEQTEIIKSVAHFTILADSVEMAHEMVLNGLCNNKTSKPEFTATSKENKGYKIETIGHANGLHPYKLKNWKPTPKNSWKCLR